MNIDEIMYEKCDFFTKISEKYDIPMSDLVRTYEKFITEKLNSNVYINTFPDQEDLIKFTDCSFEEYANIFEQAHQRHYCFYCKQKRKIREIKTEKYDGEVIIREYKILLSCGHQLYIKLSNKFD